MYSKAVPAALQAGRAGVGHEAGTTRTPGTEGEPAGPGGQVAAGPREHLCVRTCGQVHTQGAPSWHGKSGLEYPLAGSERSTVQTQVCPSQQPLCPHPMPQPTGIPDGPLK